MAADDITHMGSHRFRRALGLMLRLAARLAMFTLLVLATMAACLWWCRPRPRGPLEIFRGVVYECRSLPEGPESGGLVHLLRVDLKTRGMGLFVTPVDPEAKAAGWEYQTRWTPRVAREEGTSVLVNGVLFGARYGTRGPPGDWAASMETLVAEHEINHVWEHTYLMWFEDDLTPHLEEAKPPPPRALERARWAIGGQGITYRNGAVATWAGHTRDRRTLLGLDAANSLLYIGVFDSASVTEASLVLAGFGATQVMPIDGGTSTALCFGPGGHGVTAGTVVYPWRALPTHFGIRAPEW